MISRKSLLQSTAALAGTSLLNPLHSKDSASNKVNKRIIFFLQCHGFKPDHCILKGAKHGDSINKYKLPKFIEPLEPYKDQLNIITNMHGLHVGPAHSAYFGCLGGYRKSYDTPRAITIDSKIASLFPTTPLPQLCVGMESLDTMRSRPIFSSLSATDTNKPVSMICDPNILYELMFSMTGTKAQRESYDTMTNNLKFMQGRLSEIQNQNFSQKAKTISPYNRGFEQLISFRKKLLKISDKLKPFAPKYSEKYKKPEFETDWHDLILENSIAALRAGLTNTLTIASGCGEYFGAWKGLGFEKAGHELGHMTQMEDIWLKIRQYNMNMLVKIIKALENTKERKGTMMDNTLIVYSSNNADKQHTQGEHWPFMTIGNFGGAIETGKYLSENKGRPINALYSSLLQAAGQPYEPFNLSEAQVQKYDFGKGALDGLLT